MGKSRLSSTKQRNSRKKVFGFDIETYGQKNNFLCATVYESEDKIHFFKDRQTLIEFFDTKRFRNSFVVATNLSFDFFGTYETFDEQKEFMTLFRGSDLMYAKRKLTNRKETITFIDTFNYCKMSVEKMGKIIGQPKLTKPEFLGKIPQNNYEWGIMKEYNIQDAKVSKLFTEFLFKGFYELGATPKMTIASTAMSLFRNKYLDTTYFNHSEEITEEQFEGYYGGRTEAFKRGKIKNHKYYDVNSLYPFVMAKHEYPDPNSLRVSKKNSIEYLKEYEGMSKVKIQAPKEMKHPLLAHRTKTKLLFPLGTFTSWQTNVELRKAMSLGYKILKVHKTYYYKRTCAPFKEYVNDVYKLKKEYTRKKDPMVVIVKLLLNSLYGKFGQKFMERENYLPENKLTMEMIENSSCMEKINGFIRIKQRTRMPCFCFPIWAIHITSYARIHMFNLIADSDPAYTDTDSIMTTKHMATGEELGELKLEMNITEGMIIRPKFYSLIDEENNSYIKVKGIGCCVTSQLFTNLLKGKGVVYNKFMKFKESLKRGFKPGEIQEVQKILSLNDAKREWLIPFNPEELHQSLPIELRDGKTREEIKKEELIMIKLMQQQQEKEIKCLIDSEYFDSEAVGEDISNEEFIENEIAFELDDAR